MAETNTRGTTSDNIPSNNGPKPEFNTSEAEDYGYFFYPQRGGEADEKPMWKKVLEGKKSSRGLKCLANVHWCLRNDPQLKLVIGALNAKGCPIQLSRHVSCEDCKSIVNGGYDPQANQVVICQNNSKNRSRVCSVLSHELIHAYDYCRAKVDFNNLEHLACTEIRAANFMHCSFLTAWMEGDASVFKYKKMHQECVKRKAEMSVLMVRNVTVQEAKDVVAKVFDKCYQDLEPIGRRPRRKSHDTQRALTEAYLYGYCK